MAFEREIGAVELQQEAALDDRLVFDAQGLAERRQIGLLAVVIFILHRRGDNAGRRRGQERLDKGVRLLVEGGAEVGDLLLQLGLIDVAHLADRLGRLVIADCLARRQHLGHLLLQQRVALDITATMLSTAKPVMIAVAWVRPPSCTTRRPATSGPKLVKIRPKPLQNATAVERTWVGNSSDM